MVGSLKWGEWEGDSGPVQPGQKQVSIFKTTIKNKNKNKMAGGMAEVVECLPSNREDLSSNPITTKKTKKQ
jgi:hypothetical protein